MCFTTQANGLWKLVKIAYNHPITDQHIHMNMSRLPFPSLTMSPCVPNVSMFLWVLAAIARNNLSHNMSQPRLQHVPQSCAPILMKSCPRAHLDHVQLCACSRLHHFWFPHPQHLACKSQYHVASGHAWLNQPWLPHPSVTLSPNLAFSQQDTNPTWASALNSCMGPLTSLFAIGSNLKWSRP